MKTGMNLYKDPRTGSFYIRFSRQECPPNGKALSMRKIFGYTIKDPEQAAAIFKTYQNNRLKEKLIQLEYGDKMTISGLIDGFTQDKERRDLDDSTLRMDALSLKMLGGVIGHNKHIRAITRQDIIDFKDIYLTKERSPETIKSYFRHIKAALNWAMSYGHLDRMPKFPKVKSEKKLPKTIAPPHLDAIMSKLRDDRPEAWQYAEFALWTGCRLAEVHGLKWQDIVLFEEPDGVVYGLATVKGKRDKERNVPLLKEARAILGEKKDIGYVFPRRNLSTISHWFHDAVVGCNLCDRKYNFHSLRHTAATRMVGKGYRIETVQKILGHVDIRTTQIYAKLFDRGMIDEINRLS